MHSSCHNSKNFGRKIDKRLKNDEQALIEFARLLDLTDKVKDKGDFKARVLIFKGKSSVMQVCDLLGDKNPQTMFGNVG